MNYDPRKQDYEKPQQDDLPSTPELSNNQGLWQLSPEYERPVATGIGAGVFVLVIGFVLLKAFHPWHPQPDSQQQEQQQQQDEQQPDSAYFNAPNPPPTYPQPQPTPPAYSYPPQQQPQQPYQYQSQQQPYPAVSNHQPVRNETANPDPHYGYPVSPEDARRRYAADIRQAKQAWDIGNVALMHQFLDPYGSDPQKQNLRTFAWYYLWRAAGSDALLTLRGHAKPIRQVAFAGDDQWAITLDDDSVLIVWDLTKGERFQTITLDSNATKGRSAFLSSAMSSVVGGLVANSEDPPGWFAAYSKTLLTGTLRQGSSPQRIPGNATILGMAMSSDGQRLATSDDQGQIIVRGLPQGRSTGQWKDAPAHALAFSPDGRTLWVGSQYGMLSGWDVASGTVQNSESFNNAINSVAVAKDGQTVAVATANREGVVRLWEPGTRRVRAELRGHQDEVTHVAFSPDGNRLLTASRDHTARLWNLSGSPLRILKGHVAEVDTAIFSSNGHQILTAGVDRTAILWNAEGNQEYEIVAGTPAIGRINGLAFTPDGARLIAAGSDEGTAAFLGMWNMTDVTHPIPLQVAATDGTAMGFSPDGQFVAVGEAASADAKTASRVKVWNLDAGYTTGILAGLTGRIRTVSYSPDGQLLAAAIGDRDERIPGEVRLWNAATNTPRPSLPSFRGRVELAFTPDGKTMVTVSETKKGPGEIRLWNPATGEPLGKIEKSQELDNICTMALSPDGKFLVTAHSDVTDPKARVPVKINLWDLDRKQWVATFPSVHTSGIMRLVFSRRGTLLASGDMTGNVCIWDFESRKPLPQQINTAVMRGNRIVSLAFDRLGDRLATGAAENMVRVWDVDSGHELARLELSTGTPNQVRFTSDGNNLLATTTSGGLIAWDAQTYRVHRVYQAEGTASVRDGHKGEVNALAVASNGDLITGGEDKILRRWDLKTSHLTKLFTTQRSVTCLAVSPDGQQLAVGTGKYQSSFEQGNLLLGSLTPDGATAQPRVIAPNVTPINVLFTPDGSILVASVMAEDPAQGYTQRVLVVNLSNGNMVPLSQGKPLSLAVSPDGHLLAVGQSTGEIELWTLDPANGPSAAPIRTFSRHEGPVTSLAFSPDGATLASGSYDRNVKVWDVATGEELLTFKHNGMVDMVRFSPDGKTLATADRMELHNSIHLWHAVNDAR